MSEELCAKKKQKDPDDLTRRKSSFAPQTRATSKPAKTDKVAVIQYPIFYKCSLLADDFYWQQVFEEMASGKCPRPFFISGDKIVLGNTSGKRDGGESYVYEGKKAIDVFKDIKELLSNSTGMWSSKDIKRKKDIIKKMILQHEKLKECKWTGITKKHQKDALIVKFVIAMKKEYRFDWTHARSLLTTIYAGFNMYKTHNSKMVNYENGEIVSIDGIEYDEDLEDFINTFIDPDDIEIEKDTKPQDSHPLFTLWEKYVADVFKSNQTLISSH